MSSEKELEAVKNGSLRKMLWVLEKRRMEGEGGERGNGRGRR